MVVIVIGGALIFVAWRRKFRRGRPRGGRRPLAGGHGKTELEAGSQGFKSCTFLHCEELCFLSPVCGLKARVSVLEALEVR